MKNIGVIGKFLFIIPMVVFGLFHITNANQMGGAVPIPGGTIWVYLTGITFWLAAIAVIINKKAKLATLLLGFQLLGFAILINLLNFTGGDEMAMGQVMKDVALAGGAFMLSGQMKN